MGATLNGRATELYSMFYWFSGRCTSLQASVTLMRRIYNRLPTQDLRIKCRYDEAETVFLFCLKRKADYKLVLGQLPSCLAPLLEATLGAAKRGLVARTTDCEALLESVQIELCVATAAQAIEYGD
jgi:hypothetical protein